MMAWLWENVIDVYLLGISIHLLSLLVVTIYGGMGDIDRILHTSQLRERRSIEYIKSFVDCDF